MTTLGIVNRLRSLTMIESKGRSRHSTITQSKASIPDVKQYAADFRYHLARQPAWRTFRGWQQLPYAERFRRLNLWPRILRTPPVRSRTWVPGLPLEIHTMCHEGDWLLLIWMLKSLARVTQDLPAIVIHVQRLPKPSAVTALRTHFPDARIVLPAEAQEIVSDHLFQRRLVRCMHWWHRSPIFHKLMTVQVSSRSTNISWIDSDVLFFGRPAELLDVPGTPLEEFFFQRDCGDGFSVPVEFARNRLGIELKPRINAGMVLRAREAIHLDRVEAFLEHPEIARESGLMEQTIQALCACEAGKAAHLPESYIISLEPQVPLEAAVCRHYAGPSRIWITEEGILRLVRDGILDGEHR